MYLYMKINSKKYVSIESKIADAMSEYVEIH